MARYGKTAQNAIGAISCLAEFHDGGTTKLSSGDIAKRRGLPQPIVAKLLVVLSQSGLVSSTPGPHGGYWLAREPSQITLYDVVSQFEKFEEAPACPFGAGWHNQDKRCPLHEQLFELDSQLMRFLKETTLAAFEAPRDGDCSVCS